MQKIIPAAIIVSIACSFTAFAQEGEGRPQNYLGVNVAEPLIVFAVSRVYSMYDVDTTYLPVTANYAHAFSKHWGISGMLMYRYEKYSNDYLINEFGFAVGPRFSLDFMKGFFIEVKAGPAYAFGRDYDGYPYARLDLVLQPEIGFNIALGSAFTLTVGGGLQTLIPLYEWINNPMGSSVSDMWTWTGVSYAISGLAHLYLPVLNVSAAFVF